MKKFLSFIFMMLTITVLASCNGGNNNPSNTKNTASIKEAATELANEIDKVGSPLDVIGYDMSNLASDKSEDAEDVKTELKNEVKLCSFSVKPLMMAFNSGINTNLLNDVNQTNDLENITVPTVDQDANINATFQFIGKMAGIIDTNYNDAVDTKNRILKADNPYMYVWNEQANGSKTRVTYEDGILSLEEYDYSYRMSNVKTYHKVYVERDAEDKIFFEILSIDENGSYGYCNYYEGRNYDIAFKNYNDTKPDIFSIDLTNGYPIMIFSRGNDNTIVFEHEVDNFSVSNFVNSDDEFKMDFKTRDDGKNYAAIVINNGFELKLYDNYIVLPVDDRYIEEIKAEKTTTTHTETEEIITYDKEKDEKTVEYKTITHSEHKIFKANYKFKNGEEIYNDYEEMLGTPVYGNDNYIPGVYIKYNSINDVESLLKQYGYISSDETLDFSLLTPEVLNKDFKDLTMDYVNSELNKRIPEIKSYISYGAALENAEEMKVPFGIEAEYELTGEPIVSDSAIDLSNISLKITNVSVKNINYTFNMKDITRYKIYYRGVKIKDVEATEENGVSIMGNIGSIELTKDLLEYIEKEKSEEPNEIKIEVNGVGIIIKISLDK